MPNIQILNNVTITVDGSTVIAKDDIISVSRNSTGQEPIEGKTFGGSFHAIPTRGIKTFTIRVKAEGKGHEILASLLNEYTTSPKYHSFSIYDGTACTTSYIDCLVYDMSSDLEVDNTVSYDYTVSALKVNVEVQA